MLVEVSPYDEIRYEEVEVCNRYGEVKNGEKMNFICKNQFKETQFIFLRGHKQTYFYVCEIEVYERGCFTMLERYTMYFIGYNKR